MLSLILIEWHYFLKLGVPALTVIMLVLVLWLDYLMRKDIYNRADPLSFSLLFYSFVLVVTDLGVKLVQLLRGNPDNKFFYIASGYLLLGLIIFVDDYLDRLRKNPVVGANVPEDFWPALKRLGKDMVEPDAFRNSKFKRKKRIEFLKLVQQLTSTRTEPAEEQEKFLAEEQEKLLVNDVGVKNMARVGYALAIVFGLTGTLVLLLLR